MGYRYWVGIGAGIILGLIFVIAGLGKLLDQTEAFMILFCPFTDFLTSAFVKAVLIWLPFIELVVGLLLIIGIAAKLMAALSLALIAGFIANNSWMLNQGTFNLKGADQMPSSIYDIIITSNKPEITIAISIRPVACNIPVIFKT